MRTALDFATKWGVIRISNVRIKIRTLEVNVIELKLGEIAALVAVLTLRRIREAHRFKVPASITGHWLNCKTQSILCQVVCGIC